MSITTNQEATPPRILLYADPHFGLNRTAHTTATSRIALRQHLVEHVLGIIDTVQATHVICLGDFFDQYKNNEAAISEAWPVFLKTDYILAGNHDLSNYTKAPSTLLMLEGIHRAMRQETEQFKVIVADEEFNHGLPPAIALPDCTIQGIPHMSSQRAFETALSRLSALECMVTLMHCNYDRASESEAQLNLTQAIAAELLGTASLNKHIFIGHEHAPRDAFDGRLCVLGNVHPTSFADITDKRVAVLTPTVQQVTGRQLLVHGVEFLPVWQISEGYARYRYDEIPPQTTAQFVSIVGDHVAREALPEVVKRAHTLWKDSPRMVALRMELSAYAPTQDRSQASPVVAMEDLPTLIDRELRGTDMYVLWRELQDD